MNYEKDRIVRKDVLDFCYVLCENDSFKTQPLKSYLKSQNKDQKYCGLSKLDHFRDCYSLFYDHLAEMKSDNPRFEGGGYGYRGLIFDDSNEVHLSDIPKYATRD